MSLNLCSFFFQIECNRTNSSEMDFLGCCKTGNVSGLITLLADGAFINQTDTYENSGLQLAAAGGHLECVKKLISHGANIHQRNIHCRTAVMSASEGGHFDTVCHLLSHSANVNDMDENRFSALLLAAKEGYVDCVAELISKGNRYYVNFIFEHIFANAWCLSVCNFTKNPQKKNSHL